jgi:predicted dehydrogenase
VFQTGSQQRSDQEFRRACEYVQNGRIGKIKEVWVGIGATSRKSDKPEQPVPPGLDWDRWLGQAPKLPYNDEAARGGKLPDAYPFNPGWRDFREFSGGYVTDWGAHHYDITQWALDMDQSGPAEILPPEKAGDQYGVRMIYRGSPVGGSEILVTHKNMVFEHDEVKDGKTKHQRESNGILFIGERGRLFVTRGKIISDPGDILKEELSEGDKKLFKSPGHHENWLGCIKTRQTPIAGVEVGARSVTVCHLANLAYWHGKRLQWDPKKWEFTGENAAEANAWRTREQRAPYQLPEA